MIGKKLTRKIIKELEEIERISTMKDSRFSSIIAEDLPKNESEVDNFIRKRTELWRNTWITNPLSEIIKELKEAIGEE
jgi:hypothetical protein